VSRAFLNIGDYLKSGSSADTFSKERARRGEGEEKGGLGNYPS